LAKIPSQTHLLPVRVAYSVLQVEELDVNVLFRLKLNQNVELSLGNLTHESADTLSNGVLLLTITSGTAIWKVCEGDGGYEWKGE
jgi:hypothetical protein